jgi:hypothetical protein
MASASLHFETWDPPHTSALPILTSTPPSLPFSSRPWPRSRAHPDPNPALLPGPRPAVPDRHRGAFLFAPELSGPFSMLLALTRPSHFGTLSLPSRFPSLLSLNPAPVSLEPAVARGRMMEERPFHPRTCDFTLQFLPHALRRPQSRNSAEYFPCRRVERGSGP